MNELRFKSIVRKGVHTSCESLFNLKTLNESFLMFRIELDKFCHWWRQIGTLHNIKLRLKLIPATILGNMNSIFPKSSFPCVIK